MAFKINSDDFEDFLSPDSGEGKDMLLPANNHQHIIKFDTPKGGMLFKEEQVKNHLSILRGNYQFDDDVTVFGKGDSSLLEMHFNLSESSILYKSKVKKADTAKPMAGNLSFLAADDNKAVIGFKKDVTYNTFDIHLPLGFLNQYAGESKAIDNFLSNVNKGISTTLAKGEINVNAAIYSVIQSIKNCNYAGLARRIYMESKIYELLAASLQSIEERKTQNDLSTGDVERIKYAGQLIRENISNPFTIVELARQVGINQTKLKSGFKSIFGDTVFGYLQNIRMNEAKRYLLDTNLSIQEITSLSGYHNISNFSIAFKRTFGFAPTTLR